MFQQNLIFEQKKRNENEKKKKKFLFSKEEDEQIVEFVSKNGARNWSTLAKLLGRPKYQQVRERYETVLKSNLNHDKFSEEEEDNLFQTKYLEYGRSWSKIQKFLPDRSQTQLKNHFRQLSKKYNFSSTLENQIKEEQEQKQEQEELSENIFEFEFEFNSLFDFDDF
jgi:hypothetical protein